MNNVSKLLGASVVALTAAGCATKINDVDPKLNKYHINKDQVHLQVQEARLFWELEFDTNHDGKLSDEETLKAFNYISTLPDCTTTNNIFRALADFRKESLEKKGN